MLWALAIVAAVAVGGGYDARRKTTTKGTEPPKAKRPPLLDETVTVTYSRTNAGGVVGGLIANTAKDAPDVEVPGTSFVGKIVAGVSGGLMKIAKKATGGKLFPDTWTEPQGELFELARLAAKRPVRVWARLDVEAGFGANWYPCRTLVFDAVASASRGLMPTISHVKPKPGQKLVHEQRIACLYGRRQYKQAGLGVTVVPRPHAPPDFRLYVVLTKDDEVGVYLWMPPRLGLHRAKVRLVIWPKGK